MFTFPLSGTTSTPMGMGRNTRQGGDEDQQPGPSGIGRQVAGSSNRHESRSNRTSQTSTNRSLRPEGLVPDFGEELYSSRLGDLRARYPIVSATFD